MCSQVLGWSVKTVGLPHDHFSQYVCHKSLQMYGNFSTAHTSKFVWGTPDTLALEAEADLQLCAAYCEVLN